MPLSVTGGKFRKINPQLSQTLESLQLICTSLNQSPPQWWKSPETMDSIQNMLGPQPSQDDHDSDSDDENDNPSARGFDYGDDSMKRDADNDDGMVDLQANEKRDEDTFDDGMDDDNVDDISIASDDSIWNRSSRND